MKVKEGELKMSKWYGSLTNRLFENQGEIPTIEVGMNVTEYLYTDRRVYEVTKVINQKHIFVRSYDAKCKGGMGSDAWELISNPNNREEELVYRYKNWYKKSVVNKESLQRMKEEDGAIWLADYIVKEVEEKGEYVEYIKMNKLRFGCADYYYDWEF